MFTGLIEGTGKISGRRGGRLLIKPEFPMDGTVPGASIAVNGCCLTLERTTAAGELEFFVLEESLSRTNLGALVPGERVLIVERRCSKFLVVSFLWKLFISRGRVL